MNIQFFGASEQVTGSCYLVTTDTTRILIDCGMFQGMPETKELNTEPFGFDAASVDAVLVTHAHLDHCGRIPKLVKEGFAGRIIATEPTLALAELILNDAVHILQERALEAQEEPLYELQDVLAAIDMFEPYTYHQKIQIGDITAEFFDAGHILGSSMIRIEHNGTSVVFSGDLGNPPVPLLYPTEPIPESDYVVMESTYGARIHEDKRTRQLLLKSAIYETVQMKGVLMIPSFALERTQELLYEINQMVNANDIPDVPIYLDSPLAIKATQVFRQYAHYFNKKDQAEMLKDDLFQFKGLQMTASTSESKAINHAKAPKIIIAGSGMADGGRIIHHIERYISSATNQYLIIGYQVEGTLGRRILDGDKHIVIGGQKIDVKAKVRAIGGYSAHADRDKLTAWIMGANMKRLKGLFITHGELSQSQDLRRHLHQKMDVAIEIPKQGQEYPLGS